MPVIFVPAATMSCASPSPVRHAFPSCGASLDSHWVNLTPQANWLGSCAVSVFVSDSIDTEYDTFWVNVVPVSDRVYLPLVVK